MGPNRDNALRVSREGTRRLEILAHKYVPLGQ